jgi:D-arabinose 1-dehydrogenase-like Zn-dependent alcohol dehydrogenase
MIGYFVTHLADKSTQVVTLEAAAEISELNDVDILWAIEEFGICETDTHVIVSVEVDALSPAA